MTKDDAWDAEWALLVAERDAARARWNLAAEDLSVRAQDPFGLKGVTRRHPVIVGSIGAALAALLVKFVVGKVRAHGGRAGGEPFWAAPLRKLATLGVPFLARFVGEKIGERFSENGHGPGRRARRERAAFNGNGGRTPRS